MTPQTLPQTPEEAWTDLKQTLNLAGIAKKIGVTRGFLAQWKAVPDKYVTAVCTATGLPRDRVRPDLRDPWAELK